MGQEVVVNSTSSRSVPVQATVALFIAAATLAAARVPIQMSALPFVVPLDRVLAPNSTGQWSPAAKGARVTVRHGDDATAECSKIGGNGKVTWSVVVPGREGEEKGIKSGDIDLRLSFEGIIANGSGIDKICNFIELFAWIGGESNYVLSICRETFTFFRSLKLRGDGAIARRRSDQDVSPIRCYPTAWFKALALLGVQIQLKLIEFGAGQTEMKLICQDNYCYWEWVGVDKDRGSQVDKIH